MGRTTSAWGSLSLSPSYKAVIGYNRARFFAGEFT